MSSEYVFVIYTCLLRTLTVSMKSTVARVVIPIRDGRGALDGDNENYSCLALAAHAS